MAPSGIRTRGHSSQSRLLQGMISILAFLCISYPWYPCSINTSTEITAYTIHAIPTVSHLRTIYQPSTNHLPTTDLTSPFPSSQQSVPRSGYKWPRTVKGPPYGPWDPRGQRSPPRDGSAVEKRWHGRGGGCPSYHRFLGVDSGCNDQ